MKPTLPHTYIITTSIYCLNKLLLQYTCKFSRLGIIHYVTFSQVIILILLLLHISDSCQLCSSSVSRGLAITENIDVQVQVSMPDPVCIRCGYLDGVTVKLVTDIDDVTYNTGGNVIVNTTDISVTNEGLILNDPGNTFSDGISIVCTFNQPRMRTVSRTISIEYLCENECRKDLVMHMYVSMV